MKTLSIVVVALVSLNACGGSENDGFQPAPAPQAQVEAKPASKSDDSAAADKAEETKKKFIGTWKMTVSESGTVFDAQGKATPVSATGAPSWVQIKDAGKNKVSLGESNDDCPLVFRIDGDELRLDGSQTCESLESSMKKETTFLSGGIVLSNDREARINLTLTGTAESTNGGKASWDAVSTGRLTK